jgi:hypothetical protein
MIKSRKVRLVGHAARMREMRNASIILVAKREGKRTLGRPGRRWENNTKRNLKETSFGKKTELIWLRIGTNENGLLSIRKRNHLI